MSYLGYMEVRNAISAAVALIAGGILILAAIGAHFAALIAGATLVSMGVALGVMALMLWSWERSTHSASSRSASQSAPQSGEDFDDAALAG